MSELTSLEKAQIAAGAALDKGGQDILLLDVREVVSFADVLVIATGRSNRQVKAIADAVAQAFSARGEGRLGTEGYDEGRWVLIDLADVVVHVFQAEVRDHYDLERLWSDAVPVELDREAESMRSVV